MARNSLYAHEARPRTRALAEELFDILKPEERWYIIQKYLDEERDEALMNSPYSYFLNKTCGCKYQNGVFEICAEHSAEILLGEKV